MNRPWPLRLCPLPLRGSLWSRCYRPTQTKYQRLFASAPLALAPSTTMRLIPGDLISDSIAFTGIYELYLSRLIAEQAVKGGLFVDAGANLGYFSLLWASHNAENRVIAIEGSPRIQPLLQQNVVLNKLGTRIKVVSCALGEQSGVMKFDLGPDEQTGWGGFRSESANGGMEVPVTTLDDTIPYDARVACLKIDVEGADTWVLKGAENTLREKRIEQIYFEQNKPRMHALGIGLNDASNLLESLNYSTSPLSNPQSDCVQWQASPVVQ